MNFSFLGACALLDQALALLPDGIWLCDGQGRSFFCNPAAEVLVGGLRASDVHRLPALPASGVNAGHLGVASPKAVHLAMRHDGPISEERLDIDTIGGVRKVLRVSRRPLPLGAGEEPGWLVVVRDTTDMHDLETRLREAEDAQRTLSRRLIQAQEAERRHLALELHDDVGQVAAAVRLHLSHLLHVSREDATRTIATRVLQMSDHLSDRLRQTCRGLRAPVLADLGVPAALRGLVTAHGGQPALTIRLDSDGDEQRYPPASEIAAFRIAQEAISNAMRHSQCKDLHIRLSMAPNRLAVSITDDGAGFDVEATLALAQREGRLGLAGMQERAHLADGSFTLRSSPGHGTTVTAVFPWDPAST